MCMYTYNTHLLKETTLLGGGAVPYSSFVSSMLNTCCLKTCLTEFKIT